MESTPLFIRSFIHPSKTYWVSTVPGGLFGLAVTAVHKSHDILTFKELLTP